MSCRGERGQVAGIEVLPFGLLVFIAGALLLVNLWGVVDTKFAADAAAREATRYVVEEAGAVPVDVLEDRATDVAASALRDHGHHRDFELVVEADGAIERCTRVTITVATQVPAIRIPFIGGFGDPFDITARRSELVDPTRSGVGGRATCIR